MKKFLTLSIIGVIGILLAFLLFYPNSQRPQNSTQPAQPTSAWRSVVPGRTTTEELIKQNGPPIKTEDASLLYSTSNANWQTKIETKENVVSFIKEPVFAPSEESFKKRASKLTDQPTVLYGPEASSGMFLYTWSSLGIALLANKTTDRVFEAWYFPPMTLMQFLALPEAQEYGTTENSGEF